MNEEQQLSADANLRLAVDWAPAYELVLSLINFATFPKHNLLELGDAWARDIQRGLSPELAARLQRKNVLAVLSPREADLLVLLVRACPADRVARPFTAWLSSLGAGNAYEAVCDRLRPGGPRLPRDFVGWRDRCVDVLSAWQDVYFDNLDPAILRGLHAEAERLGANLAGPPRAIVEQVTNGLFIDPAHEPQSVTLVPQYHQRPYNHDTVEQGGMIILYPADVSETPPELPPPGLLRLTHALSDDSRLRMLRLLADGTRTLSELARLVGLSQPTVHHHLVHLRAAGLVRVHTSVTGSRSYSLRPRALEQLRDQLGAYLGVSSSEPERQPA
ncbi:MAG TPA: metalloregulator ArsR/SmtB family transcription factor [Chloroflexota bacterium]